MIHFENERPADIPAREALLDRVMGRVRFQKPSEHLRRGRAPAPGLALTARDGDSLVGSVRLWDVAIGDTPALLLGPLAVDPALQSGGIGSALMRLAIARARQNGHRSIVLIGDPEYYARFGFTAEKTHGLLMPAPVERRRFLGLELVPAGLKKAAGILVPAGARLRTPELLAA